MAENKTGHVGASRWERRKEQTHRRLLDAAATLFLEKDFEATTVEEIAALADVAKGTFFNYFESKEALLATLLAEQLDALLEELPGVGQPALARIRLLFQRIWASSSPISTSAITCSPAIWRRQGRRALCPSFRRSDSCWTRDRRMATSGQT